MDYITSRQNSMMGPWVLFPMGPWVLYPEFFPSYWCYLWDVSSSKDWWFFPVGNANRVEVDMPPDHVVYSLLECPLGGKGR